MENTVIGNMEIEKTGMLEYERKIGNRKIPENGEEFGLGSAKQK